MGMQARSTGKRIDIKGVRVGAGHIEWALDAARSEDQAIVVQHSGAAARVQHLQRPLPGIDAGCAALVDSDTQSFELLPEWCLHLRREGFIETRTYGKAGLRRHHGNVDAAVRDGIFPGGNERCPHAGKSAADNDEFLSAHAVT